MTNKRKWQILACYIKLWQVRSVGCSGCSETDTCRKLVAKVLPIIDVEV